MSGWENRSLDAAYAQRGQHGPGFNTLRLAAASTVAVHHAIGSQVDKLAVDPLRPLTDGYYNLGYLPVAVFFCISGFLVVPGLCRTGNIVGYLIRRCLRIFPLLALITLATVFVYGPLMTSLPPGAYFTDPETYRYLRNVTTLLVRELPGVPSLEGDGNVNGAIWTLYYELLCYALLAVLFAATLLARRSLLALLWLACLALYAATYLAPGAIVLPPQGFLFLELGLHFIGGSLVWLYREHVPVSAPLGIAALLVLALAAHLGLGAIASPILLPWLVAAIGLVRFPWSAPLEKFDPSYGVYLSHALFFTVLIHVFGFRSPLLIFLAGLPLAIGFAALSWFWLEKPCIAAAKPVERRLARPLGKLPGPVVAFLTGKARGEAVPRGAGS